MSERAPLEIQRWRHQGETNSRLFSFLDAQLRAEYPFSVREEFPSVFGAFPGGESLYLTERGEITSHVAYVVREFQNPKFRIRLGLIGSVVTDEAFRGRGFAHSLLREAVAALRHQGCALAILWSDKTDFYEAFGFYRAGREHAFAFFPEDIPESSVTQEPIPFSAERHAHWIWRLYSKHESRLDRSLEEQKRLCRIPNSEIYVTEKDSVVTSYLVLHKGADFEDYVHEWGGDVEQVMRSVLWLQKRKYPTRPLTLIAPDFGDSRPFQHYARTKTSGALGLSKALDVTRLRSTYLKFLSETGTDFKWDAVSGQLQFPGVSRNLKSDKDLIYACFGGEVRDAIPKFPFFLWGWDSV